MMSVSAGKECFYQKNATGAPATQSTGLKFRPATPAMLAILTDEFSWHWCRWALKFIPGVRPATASGSDHFDFDPDDDLP